MEKKLSGQVLIDYSPESAIRYRTEYAIVVIDVIRATTTAVTALSKGRRVFPAMTTDEAYIIASRLHNPLLVGELGGNKPYGFDITNSPALIDELNDHDRPMILVSSSGMQLLMNAAGSKDVYLASLRNYSAVANFLSKNYSRIAILGAGTRGQFRLEDQLCCAWIAEKLISDGFEPVTMQTKEYIYKWKNASVEQIKASESATYLKNTNQLDDLEFILKHIDDLKIVPALVNYEIKVVNHD